MVSVSATSELGLSRHPEGARAYRFRMKTEVIRRLTLALALSYALMGTLEVVVKVAEGGAPATIAFFGGTLLGGSALILCGLHAHVLDKIRPVLVVVGAATGVLASAWTVVLPVLAVVVIVINVRATAAVPGAQLRQ